MYAILVWENKDFVNCVKNENGSIKLFNALKEADEYANNMSNSDNARVISAECVEELE